ncbi:MAG TPA: DNA mismatch repair protein MutS [Roseiarcus sp.]|nr:DNA mismatch repair protein MutS [Roseiarcus sp.]
MKAFLMYRDRDFDLQLAPPANEELLIKDLELDTLFLAMANRDQLVYDVSKKAVLTAAVNDVAVIGYRQAALKDCLSNPDVVRQLYALAEESAQRQKKIWSTYREYPSGLLDTSVQRMVVFIDVLKRVRTLADRHVVEFRSEAFSRLFATLSRELDDDYFALIDRQLNRLKFRNGVLVSAGLGKGLKGVNYVLRRPLREPGNWFTRAYRSLFEERPVSYSLHLAPRDEAGAQAMSELRDRGLGLAADALAKSAEHIGSFFHMLQTELAFYIGCLNLHERVLELKTPFTFPEASELSPPRFSCRDLYDVSLALSMNKRPVGNEVEADGKSLIMVTGANQGGKTTFLRSFGLAQMMTQSGMFAPAASLQLNVVDGVFTHFKREEDATMKSGKFDEELSRMNDIVNIMTPHALILFNESFAATNEREGSEIARQIVSALLERSHKIVFVSHQFAFTHGLFERRLDSTLFLRADRLDDGRRTFKLIEGEPLGTSFGEDVYREIFLAGADTKKEASSRAGIMLEDDRTPWGRIDPAQ